MPKITAWILNDNLFIRLVTLWLGGVLLNLLAWSLGYYLLPPGALRGFFLSSKLPFADGNPAALFLNLFLFNLLLGGGSIVLANICRVGNLPLGFVLALYHWVLFGLLLGTGSFDISRGGKLAPSLLSLFSSSGFYEISAYTWLAVATIRLFMYRQESWLNWRTIRVRDWRQLHLQRSEVVTALLSVGLLVGGNLRETIAIWLLRG